MVEKIPWAPKISEMSAEKLETLSKRTDSCYRTELRELGVGDALGKKLPVNGITEKITGFEEHLAYLKEVQKFSPKQLQNVEERYLNMLNDLIHKFNKDAPLFKGIKDAKEYLYPLKKLRNMNALDTTSSYEQNNTPKKKPYLSEDTDFLIQTIEENLRENFIYESSRSIANPDEQELRFQEDTVRGEYEDFKGKIEIYRKGVAPDCEAIKDITFLEGLIQKLFEAYYSKNKPLISIFKNSQEKDRFYALARKYLLEGFYTTLAEYEKSHPKPFLTKEESDALSSPYLPNKE